MKEAVLITGGTGLIGRYLSWYLLERDFDVHCLSRSAKPHPVEGVKTFQWDIEKGTIEEGAFEGVTKVVHLAGAGIADKAWTEARRREIWDSRVQSAATLKPYLAKYAKQIDTVVSASAIGYYGYPARIATEDTAAGDTFPAQVCVAWEQAAHDMVAEGQRLVIFRIGVVMSKEGGAYPQLSRPVKMGFASPLGHGNQMLSWIHIRDVAGLIAHALQQTSMNGVYNAVAQEPISQKFFASQLARYLHLPVWPLAIPAWLIELIMGARSELALRGATIISLRLASTGYSFKYPHLYESLHELTGRRKRRSR